MTQAAAISDIAPGAAPITDAVQAAIPSPAAIAGNLAGGPDMSAVSPLDSAVEAFNGAFTKLIHGLASFSEIGSLPQYQGITDRTVALDAGMINEFGQVFGANGLEPAAAAAIWTQKAAELNQAAEAIPNSDFYQKHGLQGLDANALGAQLNGLVWDIATNPQANIPLGYTNKAVAELAPADVAAPAVADISTAAARAGEVDTTAKRRGEEGTVDSNPPGGAHTGSSNTPANALAGDIPVTETVRPQPAISNLDATAFMKKKDDGPVMNTEVAAPEAAPAVAEVAPTDIPAAIPLPTTLPGALANYATLLMQAANPEAQPITVDEAAALIEANGGSFRASIKDAKNRSDTDYITLLNTSAENFAEYSDLQKASFLADATKPKLGIRVALTDLNPDGVLNMMGTFLSAPAPESYTAHEIAINHKSKLKLTTDTTVIAL